MNGEGASLSLPLTTARRLSLTLTLIVTLKVRFVTHRDRFSQDLVSKTCASTLDEHSSKLSVPNAHSNTHHVGAVLRHCGHSYGS